LTSGASYNTGSNGDGDAAGMFTNSFGAIQRPSRGSRRVALMLSVNPDLKWTGEGL
jgi:hypothetical protein